MSCIDGDNCEHVEAYHPKKVTALLKVSQPIHCYIDFLKERADLLWSILTSMWVHKKKEPFFCEDWSYCNFPLSINFDPCYHRNMLFKPLQGYCHLENHYASEEVQKAAIHKGSRVW